MKTNSQRLSAAIAKLVGKRLSSTHHSASFRVFQFGPLKQHGGGWPGDIAIHVICPWRITINDTLLTGSGDCCFDRAGESVGDCSELAQRDSLQHRLLEEWLPRDPSKITTNRGGSQCLYAIDPSINLIVEQATLRPIGDLHIQLSGGVRIDVLITASVQDQWRLLYPGNLRRRHICVEGAGQIVLD